MKFMRFLVDNQEQIGILKDDQIIPFRGEFQKDMSMEELIENYDTLDIETHLNQRLFYALDAVQILAPIPYPKRNLFCLGKNYYDHAMEMKGKTGDLISIPPKPIFFSKTASPAIGHNSVIKGHVSVSEQVDYEVELAVVIGKKGINITKENAKDYIFGYTIVNDLSARDLQMAHIQWHKGKSLDGFCPMGPVIIQRDDVPYPPDLSIQCYVNGDLRQDGKTSDLIFDLDTIISDLSKGMTLYPGDIIITGTPAGVGMGMDPPQFLKSNDEVVCVIEHIGQLKNTMK